MPDPIGPRCSRELVEEVGEELGQQLLFHHERLSIELNRTGDRFGLDSMDQTRLQIGRLHRALADSQWLSEGLSSLGPSPGSRWSSRVKPSKIDARSMALTLIGEHPQPIFIDGLLTQGRSELLERCLGQTLLDRPVTRQVRGPLTFGVARHQQQPNYCIVFIKE